MVRSGVIPRIVAATNVASVQCSDADRDKAVRVIVGELNRRAVDRMPMGASAKQAEQVAKEILTEVRSEIHSGEVSCGIPILAAISLISSIISIVRAIVRWSRGDV